MNKSHFKTLALILPVIFVAVLGFATYRGAIFFAANQTPTATRINCSAGYRETMTPAEVSQLMKIPLIELTWVPDDLNQLPELRPHGLEWVDSSNGVTCIIQMTYRGVATPSPGKYRNDLLVRILMFRDQDRTPFSLSCGNSGIDSETVSVRCSGEFSSSDGIVSFDFFTGYPLNIAQKIAEGIRLANTS